MERNSWAAIGLPVFLIFLTSIPIVMGFVRSVEVPLQALPEESEYFYQTAWSMAFHGLCGGLFGLLGPMQFWTAFRRRFGTLHKISGRIYVLAGVVLGLSGLRLVQAFYGPTFDMTDASRVLFGTALLVALWLAIQNIRAGNVPRHRAWMIRSYALGMGTAPIAFVFFPVFVITGEPPTGIMVDIIFVGTWLVSIASAELVIRLKLNRPARRPAPQTA